jgi:glycosyltransferase involved in cell wall biosynthesis
MKISVIVRTYNRTDYLKQSLSSIHFQTHKDWEVIIFDDAGNTENLEIYKSFKESHPENRVVYLTSATPHDMYKESWSLGIKLSKGDLFVRLDDDDLLKEDALEFLSNTYDSNPGLDFSYGTSTYFNEDGLDYIAETRTPHEVPKTKDTWEGYVFGYPYNYPWRFKHNHYDEPQHYSSIVHCSKANEMCSFHIYAIRVKSALRVIDKFNITSNFVDDLEMMGSLEYLGLSHTSIKKVLCYVRNHSNGRLTDKTTKIDGRNLWEDILHIRDKVEYLRTSPFITNIYTKEIKGNVSEKPLNKSDRKYFQNYLDTILNHTKTF